MNVVIFGKGFGKPRQVNLSGRAAAALCAVIATALGGLTFGAGYWYSARTGSGVSFSEAADLADALDDRAVAGDAGVLVIEVAGSKLALVTRQMAYHHVAQGELAGEPWMVTF